MTNNIDFFFMHNNVHCNITCIICRNPSCPIWVREPSKPFPASVKAPYPAITANGIQFTIQFHPLVELKGIFLGRIVIVCDIYPARIRLHFHKKYNVVIPPIRRISKTGKADNRPSPIRCYSVNVKSTFRVKRKRV